MGKETPPKGRSDGPASGPPLLPPLDRAAAYAGGYAQLAAVLGKELRVTERKLRYWNERPHAMPGRIAEAIEAATHRAVLKQELRPDIFPAPG